MNKIDTDSIFASSSFQLLNSLFKENDFIKPLKGIYPIKVSNSSYRNPKIAQIGIHNYDNGHAIYSTDADEICKNIKEKI